MTNELRSLCDSFVNNRDEFAEIFKLENENMILASALLYTVGGLKVNELKIKECEKLLKSKTNIFSDFRGDIQSIIISKMALSQSPELYYNNLEKLYKQIKTSAFNSAEYRVLASIMIIDNVRDNTDEIIEKANTIYDNMKHNHPFLTSDEDYPLAILLSIYGDDISIQDNEIEECYNTLKTSIKWFRRDGNALQTLSHILSIGNDNAKNKCKKVLDIIDELKNKKHPYNMGVELAAIGMLAIGDLSVDDITNSIVEVDDYLKGFKHFNSMHMSNSIRRMYAAVLLGILQNNKITTESVALNSIIAITIAEHLAMMVATMACINAATIATAQ